ncbi:MAG TPA: hypothetical protein VHZ51_18265 [Ktedonobacteraceae bacterium]|nr:hypothetical protein [Ktedonobacteraceae bacterium]
MKNGLRRDWKKIASFLLVLPVLVAITCIAIFLVDPSYPPML